MPQTAEPQDAEPHLADPEPADPEPAQSETEIFDPKSAEASGSESVTAALEDSPGDNGDQTLLEDNPALAVQSSGDKSGPSSERIDDDAANPPTVLAEGSGEPAGEPTSTNPDDLHKPEDLPKLDLLTNGEDPAEPSASGERDAVIPPPITNPDRLAPRSSVVGSARDQVQEDGSLIKPKRKGPLAGLRERLAP
jgi:hypothetical protein